MEATKVFHIQESPDHCESVTMRTYVRLSEPIHNIDDMTSETAHIIMDAAKCQTPFYNGPGQWYMEYPTIRAKGRRAIVTQFARIDI